MDEEFPDDPEEYSYYIRKSVSWRRKDDEVERMGMKGQKDRWWKTTHVNLQIGVRPYENMRVINQTQALHDRCGASYGQFTGTDLEG